MPPQSPLDSANFVRSEWQTVRKLCKRNTIHRYGKTQLLGSDADSNSCRCMVCSEWKTSRSYLSLPILERPWPESTRLLQPILTLLMVTKSPTFGRSRLFPGVLTARVSCWLWCGYSIRRWSTDFSSTIACSHCANKQLSSITSPLCDRVWK